MLGAQTPAIVLGPELVQRSNGHRALSAVAGIAHVVGARLYVLAEGANEQGLVDMGCVPDRLPGGAPIADSTHRERLEELWIGRVPETPGRTLMEIVEAAGSRIKALYVMGENPVFNLPNSSRVRDKLTALDVLVVQDIFLSETARIADVVLPAQAWSERDGTFTNIERRVQRMRKAVAPRSAKADWQIVGAVAAAMGHPMEYTGVDQILDEVASVSPGYEGMTSKSLDGSGWLVRGRAAPGDAEPVAVPDARKTLGVDGKIVSLGVDRLLFYSGTTSRHESALRQICSKATAKIGLELANELGLEAGDRVRLSTAQGSMGVPVEIDPSIDERRVLLSNHFEGHGVFGLLAYEIDPVTKAAGLDGCEVSVEKEEVVSE